MHSDVAFDTACVEDQRRLRRRDQPRCHSGLAQLLGAARPAYRAGRPARDGFRHAAPLLDRLIVGSLPSFRNRGEPPFFSFSLEAEPAVCELGGHQRAVMPGIAPLVLWCFALPALHTAPSLGGVGEFTLVRPALRESPLRLRRMNLPDIPTLSLPVLEASVSHGWLDSRFSGCVILGSLASVSQHCGPRGSRAGSSALDRQRYLVKVFHCQRQGRGADPAVDLVR
jgi:hypothetical protein